MPTMPALTQAQIKAVETYLLAQAHEALVREKVEPIQTEMVSKYNPQPAAKWAGRMSITVPLTWDTMYLAEDGVAHAIIAEVLDAIEARHPGLRPKERDRCPLLVAGHLTSEAARGVVDAFVTWGPLAHHRLTADKLLCAGMEEYEKFVDLCVKLAISAKPDAFTPQRLMPKPCAQPA